MTPNETERYPLIMADPMIGDRSRRARERLTSSAAELFYRNGINATGVDAITKHARVSKRTLYQHFSTKTELVENYLRTIDQSGATPQEQELARADLPPRDRLLAIFKAVPVERFRGCPFHNAVIESAGEWATVEDVARTHKQRFTDVLVAVAEEAGAVDPYQLGHQLMVLLEGATALASTLNDTAPFPHARAMAAELIDRATASAAPQAADVRRSSGSRPASRWK
jgi:AcrR family transcriptional regulator